MSALAAPPQDALDLGRRLMAFNWLAAGYAHRDWLGPWAEILEPRRQASMRLVQRASVKLLDRMGLRERYVRELHDDAWIIEPRERVSLIAHELGTAMLGGWVRHRIERVEVALQLKVLGTHGRQSALRYGQRLGALPYPLTGAWRTPLSGPSALLRLGVSCLAALLESEKSGARERFLLRFPADTACALVLSPRQRDEALSIIHGHAWPAAA